MSTEIYRTASCCKCSVVLKSCIIYYSDTLPFKTILLRGLIVICCADNEDAIAHNKTNTKERKQFFEKVNLLRDSINSLAGN